MRMRTWPCGFYVYAYVYSWVCVFAFYVQRVCRCMHVCECLCLCSVFFHSGWFFLVFCICKWRALFGDKRGIEKMKWKEWGKTKKYEEKKKKKFFFENRSIMKKFCHFFIFLFMQIISRWMKMLQKLVLLQLHALKWRKI